MEKVYVLTEVASYIDRGPQSSMSNMVYATREAAEKALASWVRENVETEYEFDEDKPKSEIEAEIAGAIKDKEIWYRGGDERVEWCIDAHTISE